MTTFYVHSIEWDTDDEEVALPTELFVGLPNYYEIVEGLVPDDAIDLILDYLSDKYGWLVKDCIITEAEGDK